MALLGSQESGNIRIADFQLQRGGHAVEGFNALAFQVLAVLVQIDKPWSNDQATSRDDLFSI